MEKEPGGWADVVNCGINISRYPLYTCIDIGAAFQEDTIMLLAFEFLKNSSAVLSSGVIRLSADDQFDNPKSNISPDWYRSIENVRIAATDRFNKFSHDSLFSKYGTFGLFNKKAVIDCGGYRTDSTVPHYDIILKLRRFFKQNKRKYAMISHPSIFCYIEQNANTKELLDQWKDWQSGMVDLIFSLRSVDFTSFEWYYNLIFELFYPIIDFAAYIAIPLLLIIGGISYEIVAGYLVVTLMLNIIITLSSIILEQYANEGSVSAKNFIAFLRYTVFENFGYGQRRVFARFMGIIGYGKYKKKIKLNINE